MYPGVGRVQEERPARGAGRTSLGFSEGLPLRNRSGCFGETENPPDFGSPAGYGLDGSAVFGSSPQPSGLPEPAGRFHRGATRGELDSVTSGIVEDANT